MKTQWPASLIRFDLQANEPTAIGKINFIKALLYIFKYPFHVVVTALRLHRVGCVCTAWQLHETCCDMQAWQRHAQASRMAIAF